MSSGRRYTYQNTLYTLRGQRLAKGQIFGMQTLDGEAKPGTGVRVPLRYIPTEEDPMQDQRDRGEARESRVLDRLHDMLRSGDRHLIDPSLVVWPETT